MTEPVFEQIGTPHKGGIVAVCDHASNHVPEEVELGISPALLEKHIAWDIGAGGVTERLARRHHIPAHLARISRLVIDLHREEDSPGLIPETSDGNLIPGNIGADRERRIRDYYHPYHDALDAWLADAQPSLIISIHSFTPALESDRQSRPWEVGILYNEDERAARHAIRLFAAQGMTVGDNEPYSGRMYNATMNRHAETVGRPYIAIEIRNDLIANEAGQARWAAMVADVASRVANELAS